MCDRKLIVDEAEAEAVRHVFRTYCELGSVRPLQARLAAEGVTSKSGRRLVHGALSHMLHNRTYRGEVTHKGHVYGRPPTHTRFKPGQSGNANGRLAGSANMATLIAKAMSEKVAVTEGGRRRTITKGEAIAKQLVNKAASGDLLATRLLMPATKPASDNAAQTEPQTAIETIAPHPEASPIDLSKLTTDELKKVYEAALILEGQRNEHPPAPLPPSDPKASSTEEQ